jgi:hypothetical protein
MISLLIAFLIMLLVVCVIAALVIWILGDIPGVPAWARQVVLAIAGIVILIWLLQHLAAFGMH